MVTKALDLGIQLQGFDATTNWLKTQLSPWDSEGYIIGTNVEYSIYVEFGTSSQSAQPYLFRAAREVMSNVEEMWEHTDDFGRLLKMVAMRILRKAKIYCPVDTGNLRASIKLEKL